MTADQRRVRRMADERQARNVHALLCYQLELERSRRLPIPRPRPPSEPPPRRGRQSFTTAYREAITGKTRRRQ
jgi:hypothetical protein